MANQFVSPSRMNTEIAELVKLSSPSDPHHGFDIVSGALTGAPTQPTTTLRRLFSRSSRMRWVRSQPFKLSCKAG